MTLDGRAPDPCKNPLDSLDLQRSGFEEWRGSAAFLALPAQRDPIVIARAAPRLMGRGMTSEPGAGEAVKKPGSSTS